MLSRVADSFYWMSRYLERAEHSARTIEVYLSLSLDDPTDTAGQALLEAVGEAPVGHGLPPDAAAASVSGPLQARHRAAVAGCVVGARENARQIREQISAEMWEQLNRLYLQVREAEHSEWTVDPGTFMRAVVDGAHQFHGITESTMSHGEGWQYVQVGRYIERAATTAGMLEGYFGEPAAPPARPAMSDADAIGLLRACAAFEAYCRFYTAEVRPERLAEFLLLNAEFPRPFALPPTASRSRCDRSRGCSAGRPTGGPNGTPVSCARRSTTGKSTKSWRTASSGTSSRSAGSAIRSTRRSTRRTSRIRSKPRLRGNRPCSISSVI
jgi:uncharacterized alpha-E superfamily protein